VRICHITPRLPPDYSAVAQLPVCLGTSSVEAGDEVGFLTSGGLAPGDVPQADALPGRVVHLPAPDGAQGEGLFRLPALVWSMTRAALPSIRRADVVHVHGNSLVARTGALAADLARRPVVLTLYGTEIWEYQRRRLRPDLFARAYRRAAHVVFYSQGLLTHAMRLGLGRRDSSVIYPPVLPAFTFCDEARQAQARAALGLRSRHVIVTVKRVDALGGHRCLLEARSELSRTHPDTRLIVCGTGPLLPDVKAAARSWGVEGHVTFTGALAPEAVARYDAAADVFVMASLLDSCPPGALEALASGPIQGPRKEEVAERRELYGGDGNGPLEALRIAPRDLRVGRLARAIDEDQVQVVARGQALHELAPAGARAAQGNARVVDCDVERFAPPLRQLDRSVTFLSGADFTPGQRHRILDGSCRRYLAESSQHSSRSRDPSRGSKGVWCPRRS